MIGMGFGFCKRTCIEGAGLRALREESGAGLFSCEGEQGLLILRFYVESQKVEDQTSFRV